MDEIFMKERMRLMINKAKKKEVTKRFCIILFLTTLCFLLASCGGKEDKDQATSEKEISFEVNENAESTNQMIQYDEIIP